MTIVSLVFAYIVAFVHIVAGLVLVFLQPEFGFQYDGIIVGLVPLACGLFLLLGLIFKKSPVVLTFIILQTVSLIVVTIILIIGWVSHWKAGKEQGSYGLEGALLTLFTVPTVIVWILLSVVYWHYFNMRKEEKMERETSGETLLHKF